MSEGQNALPVAAAQTAPAPKAPQSAIQIIEQDIANFFKQREQAIAHVHTIDGAIQASQNLLARLKAEVIKAEAEAKKLLSEAKTEVEKVVDAVETEATKVVDFVKEKI